MVRVWHTRYKYVHVLKIMHYYSYFFITFGLPSDYMRAWASTSITHKQYPRRTPKGNQSQTKHCTKSNHSAEDAFLPGTKRRRKVSTNVTPSRVRWFVGRVRRGFATASYTQSGAEEKTLTTSVSPEYGCARRRAVNSKWAVWALHYMAHKLSDFFDKSQTQEKNGHTVHRAVVIDRIYAMSGRSSSLLAVDI